MPGDDFNVGGAPAPAPAPRRAPAPKEEPGLMDNKVVKAAVTTATAVVARELMRNIFGTPKRRR
jgi:hypothetical protein